MHPRLSVNLKNILLSISEVLDLPVTSLAMHQQRVAFIVSELGEKARLERTRRERAFFASLFHDIGALSIEDKASLHNNEVLEVGPHCVRGWKLFQSNPWLAESADLVRYHHREWSTWNEKRNAPEVFDSQLLFLADCVERQINRNIYILHQVDELCHIIRNMADKQICGEVVDLFLETSDREEFWLDLTSPRLYSLLLRNGPLRSIEIDINGVSIFARLVARMVDFKSSFTVTHSLGVACCSMNLARLVGLGEGELHLMEIAGLLHDLGKLTVPNSILEKPAGLTPSEMAIMKRHTYHTFSVLSSIPGIERTADWAAYHHERLDGRGYPFRRQSNEISLGARIMAVADVFTALAEDRPYRKRMQVPTIKRILIEMVSNNILDPRIVNLLVENMEEIQKEMTAWQSQNLDYFKGEMQKTE